MKKYLLLILLSVTLFSQEHVTVQLSWKYQFEFAGFIMAKEKGFYKELGLDVELLDISANNGVKELLSGEIDYLLSSALLQHEDKKLLDTVLIASYFQKSPLVFVTQPYIKELSQLKGKKIMMSSAEIKNSPLSTLLNHYNIDSSNTRFIKHHFNLQSFIAKEIDAASAFVTNELYTLDKLGIKYNIIDPIEYGYSSNNNNLFVSKKKIKKNFISVEKFLDATQKGWEYALSHKEETNTIIYQKYTTQKSLKALEYEAQMTQKLMFTNMYKIGEINRGNILAYYKQLVATGAIKREKKFKLEEFIYDASEKKEMEFTTKEYNYLQKKETLHYCVDPNWKPLEWIDEGGKYSGMGADFLELLSNNVSVNFVLYKTTSWTQTLQAVKDKKCDFIPMASITDERKTYLDFTKPYFISPYVIAAKSTKIFIDDFAKIVDKKFAVVAGSSVIDDLKARYKDIELVGVKDILSGLRLVQEGEVYGFINMTSTIAYVMQQNSLIDIKIVAQLPMEYDISIATDKSEPLLNTIFEKMLKSIDEKDKLEIQNRWLATVSKSREDYSFLYKILAFMFLVLLGFLYRAFLLQKVNHTLEKTVQEKTKALQKLNDSLELQVKERTQQLEEYAYYDSLTKLPNRSLFYNRLEQAIVKAKRNQKSFALFFIDLDRFKQINDSMGHHIGDIVLQEVTQKLLSSVRGSDTLSRLGGDEFTIIMEDLDDIATAGTFATKILNSLSAPIVYEENMFYISASIGISIYPQDDKEINDLIKDADAAMYKAKEEGRNNYQFYSCEMTQIAYDKMTLQSSIKNAIENEEFIVYYQPQIDATNMTVIGVEALVRWNNPQNGIVLPSAFIELAEETGLIVKIDKQVMKQAMLDFKKLDKEGVRPHRLSLNLAAKQLAHKEYMNILKENFFKIGFERSWLELEITESDVMKNPEESIEKLQILHDMGVTISVDDFGTGYSSLAYLKRLPIDKLKIDQSFICDIPHDEENSAIVKSVIALGTALGLELIAEGVEKKEQQDFLLENGCANIQGYIFAKPMPYEELLVYLKNEQNLSR